MMGISSPGEMDIPFRRVAERTVVGYVIVLW
jgi:hypothetical protein